jgi:hypothetical protein
VIKSFELEFFKPQETTSPNHLVDSLVRSIVSSMGHAVFPGKAGSYSVAASWLQVVNSTCKHGEGIKVRSVYRTG